MYTHKTYSVKENIHTHLTLQTDLEPVVDNQIKKKNRKCFFWNSFEMQMDSDVAKIIFPKEILIHENAFL